MTKPSPPEITLRYRPVRAHPSEAFPDRSSFLRPDVEIRLWNGGKRGHYYRALIDSGADYCLFPREMGEEIGLDVLSGPHQTVYGIGGATVQSHFFTVEVEIESLRLSVYAGFSESNDQIPLLGQGGFFDRLVITFDRKAGTIQIKTP